MRNLSDLNNLYSYQDLSILCEIFENQFEVMHTTYGFNPRLCNSVSKLRSGWIQKQKSKVIIAILTNGKIVHLNKKLLTGGFSSVNTRLGSDLEILAPNNSHEIKK